MIVEMRPGVPLSWIEAVEAYFVRHGVNHRVIEGALDGATVIVASPRVGQFDPQNVRSLSGVHRVIVDTPIQLVRRSFLPRQHVVEVRGVQFGRGNIPVIAGPCSVESKEQLFATARAIKAAGASMLRGGFVKPRTSPYSFQGLGAEGLHLLRAARDEYGLPIVSEVMAVDQLDAVQGYVDLVQVGARNMYNYDLLREIGRRRLPVMLKRGLAATVDEWLLAAEYLLKEGNFDVILCERGIRTFESATRNTLDIGGVLAAREMTHLPIIVDPSHAVGRWDLVHGASLAAIACGVDGLLVEVHPDPSSAVSDGAQSITPGRFGTVMRAGRRVAAAVDRTLGTADPGAA
jgi:3-deoxy-7-phosphoheptulonate synthase